LVTFGWSAPARADYHISPTGRDANAGSKTKPFATLEAARDAVRRDLARSGGKKKSVTVWLHGGDYVRTNALELYRERYPEMKSLDRHYGPPSGPAITGEAFKGVPPERNVVARNICVGKWLDAGWHSTPAMLQVENNFTNAASSLAAPITDHSTAKDFVLKKNSPAFALGHQKIPVEKIGLREDALRRALP
jgi:hypothetical protein